MEQRPFGTIKLRPGEKWSGVIGRNKAVKITTLGDEANLSVLLFLAADLTERYNMPDTLKAQHTAHLTKGNVLMSDNGRVLASIIEDTVGWHDPIGGYLTREATDRKYGTTTYQALRNDWLRSGEENFKIELLRNNLSVKDLGPPINFFSKVVVNEQGQMAYRNPAKTFDSVTLRTDLDVLLIVSNTPHPLNPSTVYTKSEIQIEASDTEPAGPSDFCFLHCDENRRAFENNWRYLSLRSGGMVHV